MDAIIVADKAVIYADREMTSPLGYVSRGKKVVVGEIPRNNAQVYPIIVSGKIAYIRVEDVSTEKESADSGRLVAERFQRNTAPALKTKYVLSYFSYASNVDIQEKDTVILDGSTHQFYGVSLKGEVLVKKKYDIQVITNYLATDKKGFNIFELGAGGAYRLIDTRKFLLRAEGHLLGVPFSSYSYRTDFRIKSYGYTLGAALNALYLFDRSWGVEGFAGYYRTSLFGFDVPAPYEDFSPVFYGTRLGLGVNYSY